MKFYAKQTTRDRRAILVLVAVIASLLLAGGAGIKIHEGCFSWETACTTQP